MLLDVGHRLLPNEREVRVPRLTQGPPDEDGGRDLLELDALRGYPRLCKVFEPDSVRSQIVSKALRPQAAERHHRYGDPSPGRSHPQYPRELVLARHPFVGDSRGLGCALDVDLELDVEVVVECPGQDDLLEALDVGARLAVSLQPPDKVGELVAELLGLCLGEYLLGGGPFEVAVQPHRPQVDRRGYDGLSLEVLVPSADIGILQKMFVLAAGGHAEAREGRS